MVPQPLRRKESAVRGILPLVLLVAPVWVAPAVGQEARERKYRGRPLKFWVRQLQAQKAEERNLAFEAITAFGAEGKAVALPVLAEMLDDLCPEFQTFAAQSLSQMGSQAGGAVPALIPLIRDKNPAVAWRAVNALGEIGAGAKAAVPELEKAFTTAPQTALKEDAPLFRDRILHALTKIGPDGVPVFVKLLEREQKIRGTIATALGEMGPKAKAAVPALVKSLADKRRGVRTQIAWALWRIAGHRAAIHVLVEGLQTKDNHDPDEWGELTSPSGVGFRQLPDGAIGWLISGGIQRHGDILDALTELGPQAKVAIPDLEKIVKNRTHRYRARAAWALWKLAKHKDAAPVLAESVLYDERYGLLRIDETVLDRLAQIGPEAKAAIPVLTKALKGRNGEEREALLRVLRKIDPKAVPAAPQ
jgi:HEAT repeat protein